MYEEFTNIPPSPLSCFNSARPVLARGAGGVVSIKSATAQARTPHTAADSLRHGAKILSQDSGFEFCRAEIKRDREWLTENTQSARHLEFRL